MRDATRVPGGVLAHLADAHVVSLISKQQVEVAAHDGRPLGKRRPRQLLTRAQVVRELVEKPGITLRRAADHHAVRACLAENRVEVIIGTHVAVGNDRNLHGLLHLGNFLPVRMAHVELLARTSVHRNGLDTRRLGQLRDFHDVDMRRIPSDAHLHRKGHLHGLAHGAENREGLLRLAHKCRPLTIFYDFRRRTAHIEVEDICRTQFFHVLRGLSRQGRVAREELHDQRPFLRPRLQHGQRVLVVEMDTRTAHHFGVAERAAHVVRDDAVGDVRNAGHWRKKYRGIEVEFSQLHAHAFGFLS